MADKDFLPEGYEMPTRRRYQSFRYDKDTPELEALRLLEDVTYPDPSGARASGAPIAISDAHPDFARAIFSGLRPEILATPNRSRPYGSTHVLPPVPPDFIPSPLVVGQDTAKLFEEFADINPEVRRTVKKITTGPDEQYIRTVFRQAEDTPGQEKFLGVGRRPLPGSNRWGQITNWDPDKQDEQYRDIYINPHLDKDDMAQTLAHELGHTLVGKSEAWANRIDALLRQLDPPGGRGGRIPHSKRIEDIR